MKALIERLKKDRLTIGSCESLTAGLFASTIAEVSGASAVLKVVLSPIGPNARSMLCMCVKKL